MPGDGRDTRIALFTPCFDPFPNGVDQVQWDELFLQYGDVRTARARFEIVARRAATLFEHRLAFLISPVARRLFKGGVKDGVINEHKGAYSAKGL